MDKSPRWPSPACFPLPEAPAGFSLRDHLFLPEPSYPLFPGHCIVFRPWLSLLNGIHWTLMLGPWIFFFFFWLLIFSLWVPSFHWAWPCLICGWLPNLRCVSSPESQTRFSTIHACIWVPSIAVSPLGLLASLCLILVAPFFLWTQDQAPFASFFFFFFFKKIYIIFIAF